MPPTSGHFLRVVHADQESAGGRAARVFAAECAAAALEVFESQRRRVRASSRRTAASRRARAEGGSTAVGIFLPYPRGLAPLGVT